MRQRSRNITLEVLWRPVIGCAMRGIQLFRHCSDKNPDYFLNCFHCRRVGVSVCLSPSSRTMAPSLSWSVLTARRLHVSVTRGGSLGPRRRSAISRRCISPHGFSRAAAGRALSSLLSALAPFPLGGRGGTHSVQSCQSRFLSNY